MPWAKCKPCPFRAQADLFGVQVEFDIVRIIIFVSFVHSVFVKKKTLRLCVSAFEKKTG